METSLKKTILIVILWTGGLLLLAAFGWLVYFNFQFGVYQDDQYKFSIRYPRTWQVIAHPKPNVAVGFLRPKDTALDTMQENFNVTVQSLPNDVPTLEAFSTTIKTQMTAVFDKNINIVEDKPLHWGWREGHEMSIEAPNPEHLKMVNAWVFYHGQVYILTFLGDINKYADDAPLVGEMIRSLKLQ